MMPALVKQYQDVQEKMAAINLVVSVLGDREWETTDPILIPAQELLNLVQEWVESIVAHEFQDIPIQFFEKVSSMGLSGRGQAVLKQSNIIYLGDILQVESETDFKSGLLRIPNMGYKLYNEIKEVLELKYLIPCLKVPLGRWLHLTSNMKEMIHQKYFKFGNPIPPGTFYNLLNIPRPQYTNNEKGEK